MPMLFLPKHPNRFKWKVIRTRNTGPAHEALAAKLDEAFRGVFKQLWPDPWKAQHLIPRPSNRHKKGVKK